MTQKVESKPCDVRGCDERSTSYSSGHGRWCDKHYRQKFGTDGMDWDEFMKRKPLMRMAIAAIIFKHRYTRLDSLEIAEKILQEIERG